jgi:hypothetical protein
VDIVPKKHALAGIYQKFIHSFQGSPEGSSGEPEGVWSKSDKTEEQNLWGWGI